MSAQFLPSRLSEFNRGVERVASAGEAVTISTMGEDGASVRKPTEGHIHDERENYLYSELLTGQYPARSNALNNDHCFARILNHLSPMLHRESSPYELVDQMLGPYRIDAVLGQGAMGAVFRAHHHGLGTDVALKTMCGALFDDEDAQVRFEREAVALSLLDHPNIVRLVDFGRYRLGTEQRPVQCLAMELLQGRELKGILHQRIEMRRALQLTHGMLSALRHAHPRDVVHRDLNPSNVFVVDVEGQEQPKLVDFGLVRFASLSSRRALTRQGNIFGTPAYMSPEQAQGESVDHRSDLYSLGIIVYRMLAGRLPFLHENVIAMLRAHVHEPIPVISNIPSSVEGLLQGLLAKDPSTRFPTADAALEALERVLAAPSVGSSLPRQRRTTDLYPYRMEPVVEVKSTTSRPSGSEPQDRSGSTLRLLAGIPVAGGVGVVCGLVLVGAQMIGQPFHSTVPVASTSVNANPMHDGFAAAPPVVDDHSSPTDETDATHRGARQSENPRLQKEVPLGRDEPLRAAAQQLAASPGREHEALEAYRAILRLHPDLAKETGIQAELARLMRDPTSSAAVVAFSIETDFDAFRPLLVMALNRDGGSLDFDTRHRLLSLGFEHDPSIDHDLNVALDLWQARQSNRSCAAFSNALSRIDARPDARFAESLRRAPVPAAGIDDHLEDCEALPSQAEALLARVRDPDASSWVPVDFERAAARTPQL